MRVSLYAVFIERVAYLAFSFIMRLLKTNRILEFEFDIVSFQERFEDYATEIKAMRRIAQFSQQIKAYKTIFVQITSQIAVDCIRVCDMNLGKATTCGYTTCEKLWPILISNKRSVRK